ncbi:hypothetical protein AOLI_G00080620 [Acnodon oligacanthus]
MTPSHTTPFQGGLMKPTVQRVLVNGDPREHLLPADGTVLQSPRGRVPCWPRSTKNARPTRKKEPIVTLAVPRALLSRPDRTHAIALKQPLRCRWPFQMFSSVFRFIPTPLPACCPAVNLPALARPDPELV